MTGRKEVVMMTMMIMLLLKTNATTVRRMVSLVLKRRISFVRFEQQEVLVVVQRNLVVVTGDATNLAMCLPSTLRLMCSPTSYNALPW